jgi:hypothetical protein
MSTCYVPEQFLIDPKTVLCEWIEIHGGMKFYWVLHVTDGKVRRSYSSYCSPLDWKASPPDNACSLETTIGSPLVRSRSDE